VFQNQNHEEISNNNIYFIWIAIGQMSSQIINVESKRIATDTTDFSSTVGMSASKFTRSYEAVKLTSKVQWKTTKNIYLLVGYFQIVSAGGESFNNSRFEHFRFNRKFSSKASLELFSQVRYNSVTKITVRYLSAARLRFKLSTYETPNILGYSCNA
jgi:hypothetical protein